MDSKKSRPNQERSVREPQRRRGELRVAALMEAADAVIAERGFEAATMAEIAARSGAQIGSLYRFFPNKEALADALVQRYAGLIDEAFGEIRARAASLSTDELADGVVDFMVKHHGETRAMRALLDARSEWSARRAEFRNAALRHIEQILMLRSLRPEAARDVAVVLLHNMKTMAALTFDRGIANSPGAAAELREMNRLYLSSKLSGNRPS